MATAFGPSLGRFGLVAATYKNAQGWAVAPDSQTDSALGRQGCFVNLASWGKKKSTKNRLKSPPKIMG